MTHAADEHPPTHLLDADGSAEERATAERAASDTAPDAATPAEAKRVVGRPWPKGVSGCPGGRPKMSSDVKEALRIGASTAAVSLVKIAKDIKHSQCTRACEIIFDRLYGKAVAALANPDGTPLLPSVPAGDDSPLDAILRRIAARRTAADAAGGATPPEAGNALLNANGDATKVSPS